MNLKELESMARKLEEENKQLRANLELMADTLMLPDHELYAVFDKCVEQAASGKGNERHGDGKRFNEQPWVDLADAYGVGFLYGQGAKKLREAQKMDGDRKRRELYGAINYIAMGVLYDIKKERERASTESN